MSRQELRYNVLSRVASELSTWPSDVAMREDLRKTLPPGATMHGSVSRHLKRARSGATGNFNPTSKAFQDALRDIERMGLITRSDGCVCILDRAGLREVGEGNV